MVMVPRLFGSSLSVARLERRAEQISSLELASEAWMEAARPASRTALVSVDLVITTMLNCRMAKTTVNRIGATKANSTMVWPAGVRSARRRCGRRRRIGAARFCLIVFLDTGSVLSRAILGRHSQVGRNVHMGGLAHVYSAPPCAD